MTEERAISVNLPKLTKLDKRVLDALSTPQDKEEYITFPKEGIGFQGIAKRVYGEAVLNCETRGGPYVENLTICYSAKSSLSRTLKKLWKNGLVKKCVPKYRRYWCIEDDGGGFYSVRLSGLYASWINENGVYCTDLIWTRKYASLTYRSKIWWILTQLGKDRVKGGSIEVDMKN